MFKTIVFFIISLFYFFNLSAQEAGNINLKIETGILYDWVGGRIYLSGPFLNIEPKLKTSRKTVIGLRFGAALNTQAILPLSPTRFQINNDFDNNGNGVLSLIPTLDYYFTPKKIRPYLGLGIGYYFLNTSKKVFALRNPGEMLQLSVNNQIGFLLRGGFNLHKLIIGKSDLSKFIVGLEFNYIPKTEVQISDGQIIGRIDNSNIALSVGYIIGNKKIPVPQS